MSQMRWQSLASTMFVWVGKMLDLSSIDSYKKSVLAVVKEKIGNLSIEEIDEDKFNAYPNLEKLEEIKEMFELDEANIDISEAEQVVLNGEFFFEHACAGEATRLALGTKYLLNLKDISIKNMTEMINEERAKDGVKGELSEDEVKELCGGDTNDLVDMSLGTRHMLQLAFDIKKLAEKHGRDFTEVMKKQKMLIILNDATADDIISEFTRYNNFGFSNVYFMIQASFPGMKVEGDKLIYDDASPKRLHNHGQMYMQKTHDDSIFYMKDGERVYLKAKEVMGILSGCKDMLSYNIEDIKYLTGSIDYPSLAKSLELGKEGYEMIMEIVAQNPHRPQKGGAAFFDPVLGKDVMIESNQLLGIKNEDIKHLNKNHNHYPNPVASFRKVKEQGLQICFTIKENYIYPNAVQGDINFLVKTAFIIRKDLKPIANWKSPATTPPTVKAMFEQDQQEGFLEFAEEMLR